MENLEHLIYDWNIGSEQATRPSSKKIEFDDETLRDGLQSPSVTDPSLEEKVRILHFMAEIGVDSADIGLPGAGPHVQRSVERLAREIVDQKLNIAANCAARTHENDIRPIVEISQRVGLPIEACTFIGSSPIRQFAEEWDLDWVIQQSAKAVRFAVGEGLPVMYVTEDTTRAKPADVEKLYTAAIEAGAQRVCVCDTVGHATPWGVRNLIRFVREVVQRVNPAVKIDWHGHSDRGLGVINSIAAIEAGADRVHGSAAGIGERVGNTPIDILMVNLKLMGWIDNDLSHLGEYVKYVSSAVHIPLPDQYPVFGHDAFRTGTGVHAAAIIKARKKGSEWLADRV
jgi:Isopropylmalate/homocitrate/citramalate synthases